MNFERLDETVGGLIPVTGLLGEPTNRVLARQELPFGVSQSDFQNHGIANATQGRQAQEQYGHREVARNKLIAHAHSG